MLAYAITTIGIVYASLAFARISIHLAHLVVIKLKCVSFGKWCTTKQPRSFGNVAFALAHDNAGRMFTHTFVRNVIVDLMLMRIFLF